MSGISEPERPPRGNAWVTLATNDTYALGALVLARSLNKAATKYAKCVMITDSVSQSMKALLGEVFDSVVIVNLLDSADSFHLAMLARPELGVTFTKIHCWLRIEYGKCVFLDADTLVLENCDELFEREELSAAPDVGWPDCFNSGVFVFRPNAETFASLVSFALHTQSFDGGDQGLLNLFFKNWALEGPDKRLPFIYNMCSTACYSYIPAFKMFGGAAKIIHFIGPRKPWMFEINPLSGRVNPAEFSHLSEYLQNWWDLCVDTVLPQLTTQMATTTTLRSETRVGPLACVTLQSTPEFHLPFVDPWDEYLARNTTDLDTNGHLENSNEGSQIHTNSTQSGNDDDKHFDALVDSNNISSLEQNTNIGTDWDDTKLSNIVLVDKSSPISYPYKNCNLNGNSDILQAANDLSGFGQSSKVNSYKFQTPPTNLVRDTSGTHTTNSHKAALAVPSEQAAIPPPTLSPTSQTCTEIPCCEQAVDTKVNAGDDSICVTNDETNAAGLPAVLSALSIGGSAGGGLEEHWRRTAWESSTADYMGRDSFDKVWEKIQATLEEPELSGDASGKAEEPIGGKSPASADSDKPVLAETPAEDPKGAPPAVAAASPPAVATPPLPSALVDVDSSSASNLGSVAQSVSQAVAPSLSFSEPSLPPAGSELHALTVDQVVTGKPSVAFDTLAGNLTSAEVAPSLIPADSGVPELPAETPTPDAVVLAPALSDSILLKRSAESHTKELPATPIPALPDSGPISPAEVITTEPSVPVLAASDTSLPEPSAESCITEQSAIPIPASPDSALPDLPAGTLTTEPAIPAVPKDLSTAPAEEVVKAAPVAKGEGLSESGDPRLEPVPVPSAPLPPQLVPRTPTVIEATPPTSPPIGQASAFPLAPPAPALVGAALAKERAETAPASQSDAEAAPIPPKRRGGPSKGGKSAVLKGKK